MVCMENVNNLNNLVFWPHNLINEKINSLNSRMLVNMKKSSFLKINLLVAQISNIAIVF